jgi:hypothetical protein
MEDESRNCCCARVRTCHARDFDGLRAGRYHIMDLIKDSPRRNDFFTNGADMGRLT